ncbi:hypothetical protein TIFTF001_016480 [Ficus carica]|uniref:Uncharacterized protein n=1 Tax=Ficus carica TaxID=3494 RepID=A0AA88D8T6_FICCA|nr:hypothetical protein TIFTF001_016480 [Ficus carica]
MAAAVFGGVALWGIFDGLVPNDDGLLVEVVVPTPDADGGSTCVSPSAG